MEKKKLIGVVAVLIMLLTVSFALAARNPSGTGQPNQDCESIGVMPNGFNTEGFAHAGTVYAGSGPGSAHANSDYAVSQYDVACYQLSQH